MESTGTDNIQGAINPFDFLALIYVQLLHQKYSHNITEHLRWTPWPSAK